MRRYCRISLLILFLVAFLAPCSVNGGDKTDLHKDGLRIIDAHTHCVFDHKPERSSHIMKSKEEYLKEMEASNVVGAIAHTGYLGDYHGDLKGRNVVFCYGIGEKVNEKEIEHALKSKKYGCVKIYLGYIHRYAYDKAYEGIYKLAEKYDVSVVFHTGDTYATKAKLKYADPMTIDEVAVDHPGVRFVIAHSGNPWINTAAEVAYKNPNVYLDVSGMVVGDISKYSKEILDVYLVNPISWIFNYIENPSKMLYGSDWPLVNMGLYINAVKRAIPEEHWHAVFYENAVNVFKLNIK